MAYSIKNNELFIELYKKLGALKDSDKEKYYYFENKYKNQFDSFRHIRNVLLHNNSTNNDPPFIVGDSFLKEIDFILKKIGLTKNDLIDYIKPIDSLSFAKFDNKVLDVVKIMSEKDYSYIPILDDSGIVIGIVSEKAVLKLISKKGNLDNLIIEKCMDVFGFTNCEKYLTCSIKSDIYSIYKSFMNNERFEKIALITENGHTSDPLLGIVTAWDFYNL